MIYKNLNTVQKQAARALKGPVLILAGAGSGKTRVLVHRITALILEGKCAFDKILAVTFTNKAAREMKERIAQILSADSKAESHSPWIGTFHSVCARILRQNIHLLPGWKTVGIYNQNEQLSLVRKTIRDLKMSENIKEPKTVRDQINLCKRTGLGPDELHHLPHLSYDRDFELIYRTYEKSLRRLSAFDFESLLLETWRLMKKNPGFLQSLQDQFHYICVDEYQDTNRIQYLLVKMLAGRRQNLCVVGDEDQSIYSWRGADIRNILDFEKDFKNCRTFFLEKNYRSTQNIVLSANALIAHNKMRKGKSLHSQKEEGEKVHIFELGNEYEEGAFVSQSIQDLHFSEGKSWSDFAALYRINAQSRALEDHLRNKKIPYKIVGGIRFYERREIKEAVSYLKLILNSDDDISFLNVINSPRRGMGKASLDLLRQKALSEGHSLYQELKDGPGLNCVKGLKARRELAYFIKWMEDIKSLKGCVSLYELYKQFLDKSKIISVLEGQKSPEAQARMENLYELGNVIEQKEKRHKQNILPLEDFLEEMSLLSQEDKTHEGSDSVTLMTLHNSKGLEFDTVFITGMEEGLFPSFQSIEDEKMEEERRLAYVGMTRAKERLFLSHARRRKLWGRDQYNPPSCFLSEIPKNRIQIHSAPLFGKTEAYIDKQNPF